ncbi:MAG: hypothetical protein VX231_07345 [Pseudomonadota bacterium]|nr:hypothetical protein [Pseudomonadota bacterium]
MNLILAVLAFFPLVVSNIVLADFRDDVGYTSLVNQLGSGVIIDGSSVAVLQVEAGEAYFPDTADAEFLSSNIPKTFVNLDVNIDNAQSSHATSVGYNFYGNSSSLTPEVNDIGIYSADAFLSEALKNTGSNFGIPFDSQRRVVNHSWVGGFYSLSNGDNDFNNTSKALKRLDWLIDHDDSIQVVGTNNGSSSQPLLASALNVITVGRTDGNHADTTVPVDSFYDSARPAIHLVAPQTTVSTASASVASAAVLLIEVGGQNPNWSSTFTTNRAGSIIYNAQRSETIKALLMAGASRLTINSVANGDIDDYRQDNALQTDNGLDWRYGAGQLNVQHSYQILSAAEQASQQDGGGLQVQTTGFDFDPAFGGSNGSNSVADYDLGQLDTDGFLVASLVWNADITGPLSANSSRFYYNASLEQFKLSLLMVASNGTESLVTEVIGTDSNTQNIWLAVHQGVHYKLRVEPLSGPFNHGYALAWQLRPFDDYDQDGSFDHQDSDVRDPCLPNVFTAPCSQDTDLDGLSDFAEGELTDGDSDGLLDYLESNIIDSDGDGYKDHEDPNNQDPCLPDASLCSVTIPVIIPIYYYILGLLLLIITRHMRLNTR